MIVAFRGSNTIVHPHPHVHVCKCEVRLLNCADNQPNELNGERFLERHRNEHYAWTLKLDVTRFPNCPVWKLNELSRLRAI